MRLDGDTITLRPMEDRRDARALAHLIAESDPDEVHALRSRAAQHWCAVDEAHAERTARAEAARITAPAQRRFLMERAAGIPHDRRAWRSELGRTPEQARGSLERRKPALAANYGLTEMGKRVAEILRDTARDTATQPTNPKAAPALGEAEDTRADTGGDQ